MKQSSSKGDKMETTSSEKRILCKGIEVEEPVNEQKIWLAVLLQAVEDWRSENVKLHRDADQFLFREKNDFDVVCTGAGIEPSSFRSRLMRAAQRSNGTIAGQTQIAA